MRATDAVDRVATVLELLAGEREGLRVSDVARALDVHKATASRLLATLAARRLLERDRAGRYRLGPGLIRFAAVALTGLDVVTQARDQLEELSARTGETVSLAVLDGTDVVYVDQSAGDHAIVAGNWVGRRSPAHASSSGKVLLAFGDEQARALALRGPFERLTRHTITSAAELRAALDDVRRRGYARTIAELEDGLSTVAAPVRVRGETVAAVSVGGPSFRLPARELPRLGRVMIDAGDAIGRRIAGPVAGHYRSPGVPDRDRARRRTTVSGRTGRPDGPAVGLDEPVVRPPAEDLAFAHALADLAASITMRPREAILRVRHKEDASPVTDVDEEVERTLRRAVGERFPGDAFLGEEGGDAGAGRRRWVVDPIDGTRNFVDRIQLWATLIALQVDGEAVVAVVDAPALGERYEAVRGGGARLNGRPIAVSDVDALERSFVLHSGMEEWLRGPRWDRFARLVGTSQRSRGLSDFWGHVLVARGSAEVVLEHEPCGVWDWAALRLIVEEAGGRMTTLEGAEPSHLCSLVSSNGRVHDEVLASLDGTATG